MRCERCGNHSLIEYRAMDEEGVIWVWRCIVCGFWTDDVMQFHRSLPSPPVPQTNRHYVVNPDDLSYSEADRLMEDDQ